MRFGSFLLCFLLLLITTPAHTQDAGSWLTWQQCLEIARKQNPDLVSSTKAVEAARAQRKGTYNGLMPNVTLTNSVGETDAHIRDTRWGASAIASMDFLNMKTNAGIISAGASLRQAKAARRVQSALTRFNLRQAFADMLLAEEQVTVSEKIKSIRHENAKIVTFKYQSGRESKGNMLRSNAELADAEASLSDAVRQLRAAQMELNSQLGQDEFTAITASGTLTTPPNLLLPDTAALALNQPSVVEQQALVDVSRAQLSQARGDVWPKLTGVYSRNWVGDSEFPQEDHWSMSGILSLPIFSGGPTFTYYAVAAANRNVEKAMANLRSVQNAARVAIENAWANLNKNVDQVGVQTKFLAAARQRNDEATIRYSSGLISYEDWEIAVSDLVNFERSKIRTDRDAVVAQAAWDQAIGITLED